MSDLTPYSQTKVRLCGNSVLLAPLPMKKMSNGIVLAERYLKDQTLFRVLAVGPGRVVRKKGKPDVRIPIELEPGDCCVMNEVHGNKYAFKVGERTGWIIVEADEIVAKWKPGQPNEIQS